MSDVAIEDLEELIGGKGWAWLMEQREKEWGPLAMVSKIEGIASSVPDALTQQSHINQAISAKRAVESFLARPQAEIARIRQQLQTRPDEHAEQRRRGGVL